MAVSNGGMTAPEGKKRRNKGWTAGIGVVGAQAVRPSVGVQLDRRVNSGEITQKQANQTSRQRALLRDAFGAGWRQKVYGGQGRVRRLRLQAQQGGAQSDRAKRILDQLMEARKQALERARTKANGNGGTTAA